MIQSLNPGRLRLAGCCRICVALLMLLPSHSFAEHQYRFVCTAPKDSAVGQFLWSIYEEAFANLGKSFEMIHAPPMRAHYMLDNRQVDGDCARHLSFAINNDLNALPVELARSDIYAISLDGGPVPVSFSNLSSQGSVGVESSANWILETVDGLMAEKQVIETKGLEQGLKMLRAGRLDVVLVLAAKYDLMTQVDPQLTGEGEFTVVPANQNIGFSPIMCGSDPRFEQQLASELSRLLQQRGLATGWSASP
ncbi:MAG: hypothetical protein AseanaTS_20450 [Candidatus Pelagadaptatus aseana]